MNASVNINTLVSGIADEFLGGVMACAYTTQEFVLIFCKDLLSPPPEQHNLDGLKQNCQIHDEREILEIKQIQLEFLLGVFQVGTIPKSDLGPPCQPRANRMA